ncbi:fungal-specific transcription factor domain-containing protein [Xylogone sp. PMI_703]|nr:fungal-specific transcription factor domain-containing protein [Xylogone sp. PMI_703]
MLSTSPSRGGTASPSPPQSRQRQPRQSASPACEECRRRKLRCDGQQPQCGVCEESSVPCIVNTNRARRGPKKGHIKALRARIALLESRLSDTQDHPNLDSASDAETSPQNAGADEELSSLSDLPTSIAISPWLRADLDQIYFEKIHIFAPILHRGRYSSSKRQGSENQTRACLEYAMWALATSLSTQYQNIHGQLYRHARRKLEALESSNSQGTYCIQRVQAWILLAIYELMRMDYQRCWTSASRAIKLVQLMKLDKIDNPRAVNRSASTATSDWVETEQKRRIFWMAYCLDRFISIHGGSISILNEDTSDQAVLMGFLSDVVIADDPNPRSSFTEYVVIATLWSRCLRHRQQSTLECADKNSAQQFWERHQWIEGILSKRLQILSHDYAPLMYQIDPLLLFTHMIAQTIILHISKTMTSMPLKTDKDNILRAGFQKWSYTAIDELVSLTKVQKELGYTKVHPLTPIPLFLCAEFLSAHGDHETSSSIQFNKVVQALLDLSCVNNLATIYSHILVESYGIKDSLKSSY